MTKNKIKLAIIFGVEFVAVAVILILIFFAGKKSYTVTFDLDGGTLLHGDLVQEVKQGSSATPPTAAKDGCYLHSWSTSYKQVTKDITVRAIWEYETTVGVVYSTDKEGESSNYCEIIDSFEGLRGDVYLGAYHDDKQVLGVGPEAFKDRAGITNIYMLDGILTIGSKAFEGCTGLESIALPETLAEIGPDAFKGCTSLKSITLPASLEYIAPGAFEGCTSLEEIIFDTETREVEIEEDESDSESGKKHKPKDPDLEAVETYEYTALTVIGERAFAGCAKLVEIELPTALVKIGDEAFCGCTSLKSVVLDEALKEIGARAFSDCEALTKILIPKSVGKIGIDAFNTANMVISVTIKEANKPEGWLDGWCGELTPVWEYVPTASSAE